MTDGRPPLDGLEFRFVTDPTIRVLEVQKGTLDFLQNDLIPEFLPWLREEQNLKVEMKPGVPNSGEAVAGSVSKTSRAAPATWPLSSASLSACSSIRPPRAQLIIRTPGLVLASASRERIFRV